MRLRLGRPMGLGLGLLLLGLLAVLLRRRLLLLLLLVEEGVDAVALRRHAQKLELLHRLQEDEVSVEIETMLAHSPTYTFLSIPPYFIFVHTVR